jgi:hypothetical protein
MISGRAALASALQDFKARIDRELPFRPPFLIETVDQMIGMMMQAKPDPMLATIDMLGGLIMDKVKEPIDRELVHTLLSELRAHAEAKNWVIASIVSAMKRA